MKMQHTYTDVLYSTAVEYYIFILSGIISAGKWLFKLKYSLGE
jgi:hypothetical protein